MPKDPRKSFPRKVRTKVLIEICEPTASTLKVGKACKNVIDLVLLGPVSIFTTTTTDFAFL